MEDRDVDLKEKCKEYNLFIKDIIDNAMGEIYSRRGLVETFMKVSHPELGDDGYDEIERRVRNAAAKFTDSIRAEKIRENDAALRKKSSPAGR